LRTNAQSNHPRIFASSTRRQSYEGLDIHQQFNCSIETDRSFGLNILAQTAPRLRNRFCEHWPPWTISAIPAVRNHEIPAGLGLNDAALYPWHHLVLPKGKKSYTPLRIGDLPELDIEFIDSFELQSASSAW